MTATVHLICGNTGAGKTTYAMRLADDVGAVRFSIDEAISTLFDADKPDDASFQWYMDRINRTEADIWRTATRIGALGTDVILDLGFSLRDHRATFHARAQTANLATKLHILDVDEPTRWHRVEHRNTEQGDTYALTITRDMFDVVNAMFELPTDEEIKTLNSTVIAD